jgi:hypothetical protein
MARKAPRSRPPTTASKEEQISAFLRSRLDDLKPRRCTLTITAAEVREWVAMHGLPEDAIHREERNEDGIFLVRHGLRWHLYMVERGNKDQPDVYWKKRDAELAVTEIMLSYQGHLLLT